ncbi:MAG: DNA translocase FtsK 4TM domain-containing protein, partial [Prevotella sp.]|nr:DNA translocase FtsK 4TM domain-containing protein [Prevotella sp.]
MAKKKKSSNSNNTTKSFSEVVGFKNILHNDIINFIVGITLIFLAIYIIIAFCSYFSTAADDQSLVLDLRPGEIFNTNKAFHNSCNAFGAFVSYFLIAKCFGFSAFFVPLFMGLAGLKIVKAYDVNLLKCFLCMAVVMIWLSIASAKILTPIIGSQVYNPGGDHGLFCCQWIENIVGVPGLMIILALTALFFLTYISKETINVVRKVLNPVKALSRKVKFVVTNEAQSEEAGTVTEGQAEEQLVFDDPQTQKVEFPENGEPVATEGVQNGEEQKDDKQGGNDVQLEIVDSKQEAAASSGDVSGSTDLSVPINPKEPWTKYKYPTLDLLKTYENDGKPYIDMKEQTANKNRIVEVLNNFGVQIRTISATVGPTITLYEITPAEGVRISKIRNLEDDIALSLAALGIRIIAPIPGKGTIGIEVPNAKQNIVSMESILNSKKFQETTMELPIAIGK